MMTKVRVTTHIRMSVNKNRDKTKKEIKEFDYWKTVGGEEKKKNTQINNNNKKTREKIRDCTQITASICLEDECQWIV